MSVDMIKNSEALEGIKVDAGAYADLIHERNTLVTALRECVVALRSANFFMKDYLKTVTHPGVSRLTGDCDDSIDHAKATLERYKHEHP